MRLLDCSARGELNLTKDFIEDVPPYAILSHTWGEDEDEVTFDDLQNGSGKRKAGYAKLQFCEKQAQNNGLQYFWIDTCCINKANHTELSEAITSMYHWYRDAVKCYVYLSDVSARKRNSNWQTKQTWEPAFRNSRWFTRGWTLQELLAPEIVEFFSREGDLLGEKKGLERQIHEITGIPLSALRGAPLHDFSIKERLRWAENRNTRKKEDKAYCLFGIFDVFMPLMYGEEEHAFIRLKRGMYESELDEATMKSLDDLQITDPEEDMRRIELSKDCLLEDCYKWILQDPSFLAWHDTDNCPFLWISGDPGRGKTMLMIALIRELQNSACEFPHAVTFFFCQSTDLRLNRATSILRGLIWKLVHDRPRLAKYIPKRYQIGKPLVDYTVISLFSILSAMLHDCPRTYLLIDALDECNTGTERDQLLKLIQEHAKSSSKAKWLLSSRNIPAIKHSLLPESRVLSLELNENHISKAVFAFVKHKTNELAVKMKYDQVLKDKVEMTLMNKADSTFLWVALAYEKLRNVYPSKTLSTLKNLTPGLEGLYARMIEHVLEVEDEGNKDTCLRILRSASLAFRPLLIEELITIADLRSQLSEDNNLDLLLDHCGSFITIHQDVVYFVHQSAKDYLVGTGASKLFPDGFQKDHSLIVHRSLGAMSETLKRDMCDLRHPGSPRSKAKIDAPLKAMSYACFFWVDHLSSSLGDNSGNSLYYKEYLLDRGRVYNFLLQHLLHWFEALSLLGNIDRGTLGLQRLEGVIDRLATQQPEISDLKDFVLDAIRVLRQFRLAIKEAPLQVYCSTLIFSPEQSLVRQNFTQEIANWIDPLLTIPKIWSSLVQTLEGHTSHVNSVVFSPDGQKLASGSGDLTVRLWDSATGACLYTLEGHTDYVSSVVFSPDGHQLASGSDDRTIQLWDVTTGECLRRFEGHTDYVSSVVFSPDGHRLASGSGDGTARLWDVTTGECLCRFEGHTSRVNSVVFSPDGQKLASGSGDLTVRLWDSATGVCLYTLEGHTDYVSSVVFSPDGYQLASSSHDRTVRLWDTATGALLQTLASHTAWVNSVAFSPSGQQLTSCSHDGTVRLWDAAMGALMKTLEGHTSYVNSVVFSSDGQQLASCSHDSTIRLWDAATGACLQALEGHTSYINSVVFSPSGRQLASGSGDGTVRLWDAAIEACRQTLDGHTSSVSSVVFSPGGQQLASCSGDGTVRLWDAATGVCYQTLEGHIGSVSSMAFSPDGSLLVSGSGDGTVRLWDTATGACLQTLEGHIGSVSSVIFSPDSWLLASGSGDHSIRLWDATTGACLQTLEGHTGWVSSVTFSPDGRLLASGSDDLTVRLWDAATGVCYQTLEGHTNLVSSVVFSPGGQLLASYSRNRTVRLWDTATGACLQTLKGYTATVDFSPDGSNLVTDTGFLSVEQPTSDTVPKQGGLSIGSEKWITWNGDRLLWLPPEYRAHVCAAQENRIGVGCRSGLVYILNFHPNSYPK